MSKFEFKLPDIGEGVAEAEIVEWHVAVGDRVEEDQLIASAMTDKATVELEAPKAGVITQVGGKVGDILPIGSILVVIETEDEEPVAAEEAGKVEAPRKKGERPGEGEAPESEVSPSSDPAFAGNQDWPKVLASPAVRKRAKQLGIDLTDVPAKGGQVHHADLDAYLLKGAPAFARHPGKKREDRQISVQGMRRQIALRMAESKRHIPHFTYVEEIDVTELERLRSGLNRRRGADPRLNLLPFLLLGMCRKLADFPVLNAHYDEEAGIVTRYGAVHAGIAVQTEKGLMVPVIRDADQMDIWQLSHAISHLGAGARAGTLRREELSGSTISISSLGKLGGIASTPIVNRPEVAIIAPNRIVERPVWTGHGVEPRKLMNVSISCDHRIVDGHDAASFVQALKEILEMPALLFA
jgi:2-oxoisovalerate dehydrogenase E2 component (dihydrolipoyl transacylase)